MPTPDHIGPFPVGHQVDDPGDGHCRPGLGPELLGQGNPLRDGLLGDGVQCPGIHPFALGADVQKGLDLRDIPPDEGELHLPKKLFRCPPAEGGSPHPHRVQHHRMAQLIGLFPGGSHSW